MNLKDLMNMPLEKRSKTLDILMEYDPADFFRLTYAVLHTEHKEYHPKYNNKALALKVSNMTNKERYELLKKYISE
jgi:hypothetical protein